MVYNLAKTGAQIDAIHTKVDGIEANADVTDATNVAAAGGVLNTGNETIAGVKTFSSSPVVPAPTTDLQAATKKYVDDNAGGAPEGTAVLSTGETGAVKFLREDGDGTCSWQVPAGSGDVSKVGTPANDQVGVWTGDGTIEGTSGLTYNGTALNITGNITLSGTVDGIDIATDVAANTAKVSNATHTGDVTGSTALTIANKTGADLGIVTGTAGTSGNLVEWNVDGDAVDSSLATSDVVTGASTDTFTNKTFDANGVGNSLSNVETADIASGSKSGSDATLVTGTAGTSGNLVEWDANGDAVDGPVPPSGTIIGTTDTQTLTNKTFAAGSNTATIFTEKHATSHTLSAAECYGAVYYVTGAATLTLPAVADGMHITVITIGAVAVSVDPNASDLIYLDGTALDDGDKITNLSTAGDIAVLTYYDATGWHASTNGWTDGGA